MKLNEWQCDDGGGTPKHRRLISHATATSSKKVREEERPQNRNMRLETFAALWFGFLQSLIIINLDGNIL